MTAKQPIGTHAGNTVAEYGIIFALILIVSLASLSFLGGSISDLLGKAGNGTSGGVGNLMGLLSPGSGGSGSAGGQAGPGGPSSLGATGGNPANPLELTSSSLAPTASATNTTSVEGQVARGSVGSMQMAKSLQELADEATDPALKAYLEGMAKSAYYLGGAQGEIDNVPQLAVGQENGGIDYNKADALRDIYNYKAQLSNMLNNPPPEITAFAEFQQATALANQTTKIAQTYLTALDRFIDDNGNVPYNFGIPIEGDPYNYYTGDGKAGSSLDNAGQFQVFDYQTGVNRTYDSIFNYQSMQQMANSVLADNKVDSVRVEATLKEAVNMQEQATTTTRKRYRTR